MRPRLVMCSAASLVLIFVVIAESFTKAFGCERSVSESCATTSTGAPSNVPNSTQALANVVFMFFPRFVNRRDCPARCHDSPFAIAPKREKKHTHPSACLADRTERLMGQRLHSPLALERSTSARTNQMRCVSL